MKSERGKNNAKRRTWEIHKISFAFFFIYYQVVQCFPQEETVMKRDLRATLQTNLLLG